MNDDTRELLATLKNEGVDWGRVHVAGLGNSETAIAGRHWIAEQERIARVANDAQQAALALAARQSADAARDAARWTMVAAIVTAAGVIASLFKP